ncbi:phosphatidylglycerophosphatase A, partial [Thioclava sp. BHET1]
MRLARIIATVGGVGYLRPASGTWASALAVLLAYLLHLLGSFPLVFAATIAAIGWGFWACEVFLRDRPGEDPSEVVIDEVAGQWIAMCAPSAGFYFAGLPNDVFPFPGWVTAFVCFRLFDIWKPWIVGRADRRGDAVGVMLDDIYA